MTVKREIPFLPQWLVAGRTAGIPFQVRRFGSCARDLGVDFHRAHRPALITQLLMDCCETADGGVVEQNVVLEMPVGLRTGILLVLAQLADRRPFTWRLRCGAAGCGGESEFELAVDDILAVAHEPAESRTVSVALGGCAASVRRPTGADQEAWLAQGTDLDGETMLHALLVHPELEQLLDRGVTVEAIALSIDDAMDRFDPLVGFNLQVVCPDCGIGTDVSPDLSGAALERLEQVQYAMMEDIHRLATRYHWSEREILEVPEWRRQGYLQLIESAEP